MLINIIETDPKYMIFIDSASEYGMALDRQNSLMENCRNLFPDFDEPYLQLGFPLIEIKSKGLSQGWARGKADTTELLVKKIEEFLNYKIFGGVRHLLDFSERTYEEVYSELSKRHEVLRKELGFE